MSEQQQLGDKLKPVVILPPEMMGDADKSMLREAGICVVECKEPERVRFLDPPPMSYGERDQAAIELFRVIMQRESSYPINREYFAKMYVDILMKGERPERVANVPRAKRASAK